MKNLAAVIRIEKFADVASKIMTYSTFATIPLQIFMSASLSLLCGLMNTLQIMIHMQLLDVLMPANALFILSFMEELGNFKLGKLIPMD